MLTGGICRYQGASSQLDAAVKFLSTHRGSVRLVTLDIGANDIDACASAAGLNLPCAESGLHQVVVDLPQILHSLRAADPNVRVQFAAMDYYDPFLAAWLEGSPGRQLAGQSLTVVDTLNHLLLQDYQKAGFIVAPVSSAFATSDTRLVNVPGLGQMPRDVATLCALTWACTLPPVGPNIHANAAGYEEIARSFAMTLAAQHK